MALTTSLSNLSCGTGRTTVSVPSAVSVQVCRQGGRSTLRSVKTMSTRTERETASAVSSMKPPKLAVTCTVRTTIRKGWASSGTGWLPDMSVSEPRPAGTKYSWLIQTPQVAGRLNAASCTMSSCISASAVKSCRVMN